MSEVAKRLSRLPAGTPNVDSDPQRRLEMIEQALASSGVGYWNIDLRADHCECSEAWFAITGWAREAWYAVHQPWQSRCHPDDLPRARETLEALLNGDVAIFDIEYRLARQDGGWRWFLNRGAVGERDKHGQALTVVGTTIDIDARKRAESELRESEFRYRTVANLVRGCVYEYTFDESGRPVIRWGNESLARIFGRSAHEITSQDYYDRVHPDDRAASVARLARQRAGEATTGEFRIYDAHGDERRLHVVSRPMVDANGQVERVLCVAHDVSDLVRMREALEYSEFRYRTVAALTPGYAHEFRVNPDGTNTLVWASEGFTAVYGCDHKEFTLRGGWEAFCHPDDLPASYAREQVWNDGTQTEGVARVVGLDGEVRWLRCINRPLKDPVTGAVRAVVGIGHDITDVMRKNEAVRHSEQRFRLAVAAMSGLVYEVDLVSGEVLRWPGLEALLGYQSGEVANTVQGWQELLHPDDRQPVDSDWEQLNRDEQDVLEFEYRARHRDGHYEHLLDRALVLRDTDGRPRKLIGCTTNISERKRLERELLEISNREQQRIGNDLHDGLGQELTGISLLLRTLAQRLAREYPAAVPSVEQALKLVKGAIDNARTLAKGLSPANLERGGLEFALRDLVAQLRRTSGVAITYRCRGGERLRIDESVATHLYRIAQEAISNSLRHAAATVIRVNLDVTDDQLRLRVIDDGRGLPQTSSTQGMGLKIMQYRVRMIGGELILRPRMPQGSEVVCTCRQPLRPQPDS